MKTVRAFLFSVMCLAPALPLLGEAPDWENEEVTGINKEAPRASVLPAGDKTLSLNGDWKFKFSMTPDGRPADFFKPSYSVSGWDTVKVPSNWQLAGLWNGHLHERPVSLQAESPQGDGRAAQELARHTRSAIPWAPTDGISISPPPGRGSR